MLDNEIQFPEEKWGHRRVLMLQGQAPTSYPSTGIDLGLERFGFQNARTVLAQSRGGYTYEWDRTTKRLRAFYPTNMGSLAASVGVLRLTYAQPTVLGSANTNSENADAGAEATNGHAVAALAAVAAGAWTHGALTDPDVGRNVCISIQNDSGGPLALYEGAMVFTVTGTWRGAAQTETITFTSTAGNKSVATANWRVKYGVKPFDTVTNVTVNHVPADGLKISAGLGSKIGLPNDLKTPAEADVVKITKNGAGLAPTGLVDATNMTVNLDTLTDADKFSIVYDTGAVVASSITGQSDAVSAEVPAATNLSAVTDLFVLAID